MFKACQAAASIIDGGDSAADVFNCERFLIGRICQIDASVAVMAGDTVFRSGRFCADETIIYRHTQAAVVTAVPEIESSQRRKCSCLRLMERKVMAARMQATAGRSSVASSHNQSPRPRGSRH